VWDPGWATNEGRGAVAWETGDVVRTSKILIIGAGLGGLCTASALAQVGAIVDVVEIKPDNTVPGVGFGLRLNALRALREIGLYDRCLSIGLRSPSMSYYDRHGAQVVELPFGRQLDGMPNNVLLPRVGFLEIATERAQELGCTIRMGTTFNRLEQDATSVSVSFNDGTSGQYDLVIGFDGIKSAVREELFGHRYDPTPSGGVAWRTALPAPEGLRAPIFCQGLAGKVGFAPLAGGMMYMLVTHAEHGRPRHDPAQFPRLMYERAREIMGDSDFMAESIEQVLVSENVAYTPLDIVMVPYPWFRGRVMIMGDAAHAMTPYLGSGAAMAIEDGVVFARLLDTDDSLEDVQQKFMARRLPRVKTVWDLSLSLMREEFDSATPDALERRLAYLVNEEPAANDYVHRVLESDY
jgi:2-polyprenyl-6-methoxyphenol hydroxylase-like FAD-dependent oxidoreductase